MSRQFDEIEINIYMFDSRSSLKMMRNGQWTNKSIYVQDLFIRGNNIGNGITAEVIKSFQKCCALSSVALAQK